MVLLWRENRKKKRREVNEVYLIGPLRGLSMELMRRITCDRVDEGKVLGLVILRESPKISR